MSLCGMNCFPAKHATLVNNCYPTIPGETKPKSNELSYLQFYAESRPEKLTKVGVYLERKVESDIWKKRIDFVKVSMLIWKSVINTSPSQVNLYADPLLKSIKAVLTSEDQTVYPDATETFSKFCEVNGKMTLLPDTEIFELYIDVIKTYCSFAVSENSNPQVRNSLRKCGIQALSAVSRSDILHNSDNKSIISLIVPAFIFNISAPIITTPDPNPTQRSMDPSSETEEATSEQLNALASHGFSDLARLSSIIHLRILIDCIFNYVEAKNYWAKIDFVKELIQLVSSSAQPQFRYVPVAVVLKLLEAEENILSYVKLLCLIKILESLLVKRQSLVGISVLEILNTLMAQLVSLPNSNNNGQTSPDVNNANTIAARSHIIETIGKLGTQIYYSDQIMDVLSYLVNKLKIGTKDIMMGNTNIVEARVLILQAMTNVLKEHHKNTKKPSELKSTISLNVFTSTISLLLNESPQVRLEFFYFIHELIHGLYQHERVSKSHEREFIVSLHRALFDYASNPLNLPIDYMILYHILISLYPSLGEHALLRTIPLIFRLQALEPHEKDVNLKHHLALSGVVANFFTYLGVEIPCEELTKYSEDIKNQREVSFQTLSVLEFKKPEELRSFINTTFEDLEAGKLVVTPNAVNIFFDPEIVTEILMASPQLEVSSDDAKRQLLEEYNPEKSNYDFQESKFRIRPSRSVRSQRNNIESNITSMEPAKIVRIENLKDALSVPNQDSSEFDSDSEAFSPSISTSKKSPREFSSRVDVNTLLQSISTSNGTARKSSVSLVNGPYQNL